MIPPDSSNDSARFFARHRREGIVTGPQLALLHAGLAGIEPGIFHECAASPAALAVSILPAPVAQFVFHGADIGRVGPTREIETMAVHKSAGDRFNCCGNTRCFRNGRWYSGLNRLGSGSRAASNKQCGAEQDKTEERDRSRGFHGISLIPCRILRLFMDLFDCNIFTRESVRRSDHMDMYKRRQRTPYRYTQ